jgi:hypothetical protein
LRAETTIFQKKLQRVHFFAKLDVAGLIFVTEKVIAAPWILSTLA